MLVHDISQHYFDVCLLVAASSSAADLASAPSVGALAESAIAASDSSARQVLGIAEPGENMPVPHGWRSSGRAVLENFACFMMVRSFLCDSKGLQPP